MCGRTQRKRCDGIGGTVVHIMVRLVDETRLDGVVRGQDGGKPVLVGVWDANT
jgi:hypothetical protein